MTLVRVLLLGLCLLNHCVSVHTTGSDGVSEGVDQWVEALQQLMTSGWSRDRAESLILRNVALGMLVHPQELEVFPAQTVQRLCAGASLSLLPGPGLDMSLDPTGPDSLCREVRRVFYEQCREYEDEDEDEWGELRLDFLEMPPLAFGTGLMMDWGDEVHYSEDTMKWIEDALNMGYRHIDTAEMYGNDRELGVALTRFYESSGFLREDVWITSKIEANMFSVEAGCRAILERIGTDYLDLLLLHMPVSVMAGHLGMENPTELVRSVWRDMERLITLGLVRHIGVSNHAVSHLQEILSVVQTTRPYANQVEFNPFLQQRDLVKFCEQEEIRLMAFSTQAPFTQWANTEEGRALSGLLTSQSSRIETEYPHLAPVAPSQVLLRYSQQKGFTAVVASRNHSRLLSHLSTSRIEGNRNIDLSLSLQRIHPHSFSLSAEDIGLIDDIGDGVEFRIHRIGIIF